MLTVALAMPPPVAGPAGAFAGAEVVTPSCGSSRSDGHPLGTTWCLPPHARDGDLSLKTILEEAESLEFS